MTAEVARRLEPVVGAGVRDLRLTGSQHRWQHYRAVLADGREVFAKVAPVGLGGVFEAEARGLRWLASAAAVPVPAVLGWDEATLAVSWVPSGRPDAAAAERFGRDLARLHGAGAAAFGAPWPGFIASLSLPNDWRPPPLHAQPQAGHGGDVGPAPGGAGVARGGGGFGADVPGGGDRSLGAGAGAWPEWYADRRVRPYLRRAVDSGALSAADAAEVEAVLARAGEMSGPAEPPSRIHGDLWSGNVLWSGGRGWLIDPAAHGGHRETDLAMLALFGAPYLDRILGAYQEVAPLAAGWRQRLPLHQLHPLLVHVCLFGAAYRDATLDAARALRAL
ncbi:MAG TPA: fructosamine kinase family protein [Streptosporangiaceae bacterium]